MVEWLVGWFCPYEPWQALPGSLDCLLLVVALPLAGLACPTREALLLPMPYFSSSALVSLSCMLVLPIPWFFNLCLELMLQSCLCTVGQQTQGLLHRQKPRAFLERAAERCRGRA